jgi:pimeloyl-ACP methyl ester carboxylesterase
LIEQTDDPRRIGYLDLAHAMLVFERFGAPEQAARHFMDYWIGPGSIDTFDADRRAYVVETIGRVSDEWLGTSMYAPGALTAADISTIAAKTLIVCAKNTKPAARAVVEVLRQALPGADYVEIPGAGHMAPVTHPDRVNAKLIEFIDSPAA